MSKAAVKYVEKLSDFVASTIRAEASRRGLTQKDLTRAIGMSTATMSARWNGVRPWALDELAEVAELFGCSVPELISGDIAQKCRTPAGGSHRGGPLRARRDSNPQPSDP
ncbi:MAG: helix-turn-helix domain-containing protein [Schaalia turicensis]